MLQFFDGRRLRYEIQVLREGVWRLLDMVEDGREQQQRRFDRRDHEELEARVLARARALLAAEGNQAVKVIRERIRSDGFATHSEIFHQRAEAKREAPVSVGRWSGPVPALCSVPEDLTRRPACRIIGAVMRPALDKLGISALELLHHQSYIRKLQANHSLIQGAIHHVAQMLGDDDGPLKERLSRLQHLADGIDRLAREAAAERKLPVLEENDLARLDARIEARCGTKAKRYYTNVAIARRFEGMANVAKLDAVLEWFVKPLSTDLLGLCDEWIAGFIDISQVMMDLLGRQPNLAAALEALADIGNGKPTGEAAIAARLARGIAAGQLPLTAETIWDRLIRELRRGKPLSRNDERREWGTLMQLLDTLPARCPEPVRAPITEALKMRVHRLQEAEVA